MKTAMQELIEWIEGMPALKCEPVVNGIYDRAKELLANEQKQIHKAYIDGVKDSAIAEVDSEDYYSKTYTNQTINNG